MHHPQIIKTAADEPIKVGGDSAADVRQKAMVTVALGCGHVSYYSATAGHQARYEVTCLDADHNADGRRCRLTRYPQHRPGGTIGMFLCTGHLFDDRAQHCDELLVRSYPCSDREAWRQVLADAPNGKRLLSFERERHPGEGIEPP